MREQASSSGVSRRRVTTAAAWTIPVVAVSIATPAAAASSDAWNIALTTACLPGPATGYAITETLGVTPPASLPFSENLTVTVEYPGASTDSDGARFNHANSVALQMLTLLQNATIAYQDAAVSLDSFGSWVSQVGTKPGSPDTGQVQYLSQARSVVVSGLTASGVARYGYHLDLSSVDTTGLSATFTYYLLGTPANDGGGGGELPPSPGSQGENTSDDFIALSGLDKAFTLIC